MGARLWCVALGLALLGVGCTSDPCAGVSGSCVSARVEGGVSGLDQLRVVLGGAGPAQLSPRPPAAFSLPVRLAIALPAGATSPATLTVEGLAHGQTVATSGPRSVSFTAGAHASYTFTLVPGAPADMGLDGGDMGGIVPGHVTVLPSKLTFPAAPRGTPSAPQTLTVYNRTGQAVSTVPLDLAGVDFGMANAGDDFMPAMVSPAGCMLTATGISVPADVDCQVQIVFTPSAMGPRGGAMSLGFSNGDVANLTFDGVGTPVWTAETAAPAGQAAQTLLTGVWVGGGVAHVVGGVNNGTMYVPVSFTSPMRGTWNSDDVSAVGAPFVPIGGIDATHLWAGAGSALYSWNAGSWTLQPIPPFDGSGQGPINGVWAASASEAYAVTDSGDLYRYDVNGMWKLGYHLTTTPLNAISGAGSGEYVVVGATGYMVRHDGISGTLATPTSGTSLPLRGVWEAAPTNIFAVGDAPSMTMPGTIVHCTGAPLSCALEVSPLNGPLAAVAGRKDPMTGALDIWAVGALGNEVLHSTGDGKWTAVRVPNNQAMNAVYVLPSGEVYAVGAQGEINHLY